MSRMFNIANNPALQAKIKSISEEETQRPKAEIWCNLVVDEGITDDEGNPMLTKLTPYGLALDTMPKAHVTASKSEFNKMLKRTNAYLDQLIEAGKSLKPGESMLLDCTVQVQLYRTNVDVEDTAEDTDELMVNIFRK